jgi:hypothetical protein
MAKGVSDVKIKSTRLLRIEPPVVEIEDVHVAGSCDDRVVRIAEVQGERISDAVGVAA